MTLTLRCFFVFFFIECHVLYHSEKHPELHNIFFTHKRKHPIVFIKSLEYVHSYNSRLLQHQA